MEPTKPLEGDAPGKPKSGEASPSHTILGTEMRRDHESVDDFEHLDPESSPVKETAVEVKTDSLDKLVLLDTQDTDSAAACSSNLDMNNSPGFSFVSEQKFDHSPGNASPSLIEDKLPSILSGSDSNLPDTIGDATSEFVKNTLENPLNDADNDHDLMKVIHDLPKPPTSFGSSSDLKQEEHEPETVPIHVDTMAPTFSSSDYSMPASKNDLSEETPLVTFETPPFAPVSSIAMKREELVAEEKDLSDKDDDSSFVMAQRDHFYEKNSTEDLVNLSNELSSNVMPSAPMEEFPPEPAFSTNRSGMAEVADDFHSDEEPTHLQDTKPVEVITQLKPTELAVEKEAPYMVTKESPDDKHFSLLSSPCSWFNPEKLNPRVVQLIYWRNPKESGAVFGSVLAILLSLSYFSLISVVAYLSLSVLCVTLSFRVYKSVLQAIQKNQDGHPFKDLLEMDLTMPEDRVQEVARTVVAHLNAAVTELRRLFLVEDLVDSLKFGVGVWCLTYVGAWFNGMTLIIIAFVGLFTLPKGYENNKAQVDQNLELINKKLSEISAKVKAAIPIGKKEKPKEQ
ncbi:reticulon-4 isoform X2 [Ischnura elegans]|uniref:reticulon-4 isoform X2 n=1 Tax=Ischnura elegans TaxID=197161 RepID=UPI001ED8912D|nr:reticulon-4 isoform X2 [Ischnura elegans]